MGRAGITLVDVEKAALQLQGRGKNPTVDAIRELLGTGSKSTIIQHLKTWRAKDEASQGNLPAELVALVTGLWERVNTQAEERIIENENGYQEQVRALQQDLHSLQCENHELTTKCSQLEESLLIEQNAKVESEKERLLEKQEKDKLRERCQIQIQQIENHKSENARLHQLATNIQANLEHYQNAVQEVRTEQSLAMEKQRAQFQQELAESERLQISHRKLSKDLELQLNQVNDELQQLKEQYHLLRKNHQNQARLLQKTTTELSMFKERSHQYQQQLKVLQNDASNKNQQLIELEKQVAILTDQHHRLQKNLADAEDKIEMLRDEKLFLLQEKAQLECHLKHLKGISINS